MMFGEFLLSFKLVFLKMSAIHFCTVQEYILGQGDYQQCVKSKSNPAFVTNEEDRRLS